MYVVQTGDVRPGNSNNEWVEPTQIMEAGGKFVAGPFADDRET